MSEFKWEWEKRIANLEAEVARLKEGRDKFQAIAEEFNPDEEDLDLAGALAMYRRENAELREALDRSQAEAMEGHRAFAALFGEWMNGRDFATKQSIAQGVLDCLKEDLATEIRNVSFESDERQKQEDAKLAAERRERNLRETLKLAEIALRDPWWENTERALAAIRQVLK